MKELFNPKNIAIIGASNVDGKIGNTIMKNLLDYNGKLYPININDNEVCGIKAYKTALELPEKNIDLAIIAIPKEFVAKSLVELGKKKTKFCIIISAGFKETGDIKAEDKIKKIAKQHKIRLIGPNTLGCIDLYSGLDCIFLPENLERRPHKGKISIISQSGTIGATLVDLMAEKHIGLSKFISYGNASDVNESDLLEYLEKDPNTKTIIAYVEEVVDGERFINLIKKHKKPIIFLKAGITERGQRAVASHTGALAGQKEIYDGILKQYGVIQVYSVKNLLEFAKIQPLKKIKDVCIITNGGGYGIILTDQLELNKIKLANLPEKVKTDLKKKMPLGVSVNNPVDLMGDAGAERYINAIENTKAFVDTYIIVLLGQTPKLNKEEVEKIIEYLKKQSIKKVVFLSTYSKYTRMLEKHFITFEWPNTMAKALEIICNKGE